MSTFFANKTGQRAKKLIFDYDPCTEGMQLPYTKIPERSEYQNCTFLKIKWWTLYSFKPYKTFRWLSTTFDKYASKYAHLCVSRHTQVWTNPWGKYALSKYNYFQIKRMHCQNMSTFKVNFPMLPLSMCKWIRLFAKQNCARFRIAWYSEFSYSDLQSNKLPDKS